MDQHPQQATDARLYEQLGSRATPLVTVIIDDGHRGSHCAHCKGDIRKWIGFGPNTGGTPAGLWVHTDTDRPECAS